MLEQHRADAVAAAATQFAGPVARATPGFARDDRRDAAAGLQRGRTVRVGRVANAEDAATAVLCAVAGADLVVDAAAPREVIDRLCDDLRRLGEVEHRIGPPPSGLDADQRSLLALLLGGATLGQAARELHLSRRTADRRLAAARAALGARTTSEAVAAAARAGVAPVTPGG